MKNRFFFFIILGLIICLFSSFKEKKVLATDPHLFLSPSTGNYSNDFSLEIRVDTGGQAAGGVDVYLQFPFNLLKVKSITDGNAFSEVASSIQNNEGKVRISAYFPYTEAGRSFNGTNGLIATLNFQILNSGTANISFICNSGETNESNIIEKTTSTDIIVCNTNQNGSYILSSGNSTFTPTSTPTIALSPTPPTSLNTPPPYSNTPTPSIPVTGINLPTLVLSGIGILIFLTGLSLKF